MSLILEHQNNKTKLYWVLGFIIATCTGVLFVPAIPQDQHYHLFIDTRSWLGIPNIGNVLSNLPFVFIGALGLYKVFFACLPGVIKTIQLAYTLFFIGVFLTGFGSSYYHWNPSNSTLVWDRLPMTLSFMPFFAIIWAENISQTFAKKALFPLIGIGFLSVFYWSFTESQGRGDLRLYGLVQFLPLVIIPFVLLSFRSSFSSNKWIWWTIAFYILAKVFEAADEYLFSLGNIVSGHSIKHVSAAMGTYCFYLALKNRINEPLNQNQPNE